MAATYSLISSNVLTGTTASVTFSAIPSTYTDLVVRASIRNDGASSTATLKLNFNGDSSSIYSWTRLRGDGSAASSGRSSATTYNYGGIIDANTATSNTFSSTEIYVPNYTVSQNRVSSIITTQEDNNANAYIDTMAGLYSSTTAITSIVLASVSGNFLTGSSFYLYGIKNS